MKTIRNLDAKMKSAFWFVIERVLILSVCVTGISCTDYNDVLDLQRELFANYTTSLRPKINQSEVITVYTDFRLVSILSFDEKAGTFETICFLAFSWVDEKIRWDPSVVNITSMYLHPSSLWLPETFLQNSASSQMNIDTGDRLGQKVLIHSNGSALHVFGGISTTRCDANLLYFPFDKHSCEIQLLSWAPTYAVTIKNLDMPYRTYTFENKEWNVLNVMKKDSIFTISNNHSMITFTIHFQRKPAFYVLNILLPIPCLGLLNIFVFKLPVSLGERVSFSITILLTLVFFLNMIADSLPPVAEPISLFNIMVMLVLLNSFLIGICTILSSTTYDKRNQSAEVPKNLRKWTALFLSSTRKTNKISSIKTIHVLNIDKIDKETFPEEEPPTPETITWDTVSEISDKLYTRFFTSLFVIEWVIYFFLILIDGLS